MIQPLVTGQLLCFDDAYVATMEPKQLPGELRQIGLLDIEERNLVEIVWRKDMTSFQN